MEQTQHNASCTALRALRGDEMVEPDEVAQMLRLKALGWGHAADRCRAWRQPWNGEALHQGGRLDALCAAQTPVPSRRA